VTDSAQQVYYEAPTWPHAFIKKRGEAGTSVTVQQSVDKINPHLHNPHCDDWLSTYIKQLNHSQKYHTIIGS